jgi:polar amino acid transport system substrate-binding protein
MNTFARIRSPLLRALLAAALGGVCASALAADGLERAKQRGELLAGIHYVVPEYKGGMKFRTAEALDTALLEDVARRVKLPLATVRADTGQADIALVTLAESDPLRRFSSVIPTGYFAGPMAIMRTDTDIKAWEQLKGRKVCVSEGGLYAGTLAAGYGAIEKVHKTPADSLLALRIGACDAAVHDSTMLEQLIKLPEWKKFSARLPVGPRTTLAFVVPAGDKKSAAVLKRVAIAWAANGYLDHLVNKAVRQIAFEVYLDQDVPDCH